MARRLAPAVWVLGAASAWAAPVTVSVQTFGWSVGAGYGVDASEGAGTLLAAAFDSAAFVPQSQQLANAGDSVSFNLGAVQFSELNAHAGIRAAETDALDVLAQLGLGGVLAGAPLIFSASVVATTGSVSDGAIDWSLVWLPQQRAFGDGGLVEVTLGGLDFVQAGSLMQTATLTLLRAPAASEAALEVPEPTSLALFGLALAGFGIVRTRRARA